MLVILDTCNIGVRKEPQGGLVILLTDIEGFPGNSFMIPIEGKDRAQELINGMQEALGPKLAADMRDMRKEVQNAGLEIPHS